MIHHRLAEILEFERIDDVIVEPLLRLFAEQKVFQLSFFDMPLVALEDVPEVNWLPKKLDRYEDSISAILKSLESLKVDSESISRDGIDDLYALKSTLNSISRKNKNISKIVDQIMTEVNADFSQITSKIPSPHKYRCSYFYEYREGEVEKIERSVSVRSALNRGQYHFSLARNSTPKRLIFFSNIQVASLVGRGHMIEGSIQDGKIIITNQVQTWIS